MGQMRVIDQTGDTTIEWDPSDKESTEKAKEQFKKLKDEGYEFFEVKTARGKQVKRFSKKLGKVLAAPAPAKNEAQKRGGKALAGGPLDTAVRGLGSLPEGFAAVGHALGGVPPTRR